MSAIRIAHLRDSSIVAIPVGARAPRGVRQREVLAEAMAFPKRSPR